MNLDLVFIEAKGKEAVTAVTANKKLMTSFLEAVHLHGGNVDATSEHFTFYTTCERFNVMAAKGIFETSIVQAFNSADAEMTAFESGLRTVDVASAREIFEDRFYLSLSAPVTDLKDIQVSVRKDVGPIISF